MLCSGWLCRRWKGEWKTDARLEPVMYLVADYVGCREMMRHECWWQQRQTAMTVLRDRLHAPVPEDLRSGSVRCDRCRLRVCPRCTTEADEQQQCKATFRVFVQQVTDMLGVVVQRSGLVYSK